MQDPWTRPEELDTRQGGAHLKPNLGTSNMVRMIGDLASIIWNMTRVTHVLTRLILKPGPETREL